MTRTSTCAIVLAMGLLSSTELIRGAPFSVSARFAAAGGVKLGERLPPGSYVMQISATTTDPKRQGRSRIAVQRIGFDVR